MGGRLWHYFVPHEDDVAAALDRLRAEEFRQGRYERFIPSAEDIEELPELAEEDSQKPDTIEELLSETAESGTSSILDITHISDEPEFGAISPMPAERIREIFGTDKPTRKMVESKIGYPELADDDPVIMEGWQGYFFTVYLDGKPHELFFVGSSGD